MSRDALSDMRKEFVEEVRMMLVGPWTPREELREKPHKRYLTGMIFPRGASAGKALEDEAMDSPDVSDASADADDHEIDSPMDLMFQKLPASVGLTFALNDGEPTVLIELSAASYVRTEAECIAKPDATDEEEEEAKPKKLPQVWKRLPITGAQPFQIVLIKPGDLGDSPIQLNVLDDRASLHVLIRESRGRRIATVSLLNKRTTPEDTTAKTEDILFQVALRCRPSLGVPAYPEPPRISLDPEAEELSLQYRKVPTFAVGHGCGAFWPEPINDAVSEVAVDFLPAVEVPPVTTDINTLPSLVTTSLSLARLQDPSHDPLPAFRELTQLYQAWHDALAAESVEVRFQPARGRVLARVKTVIGRMMDGIELLQNEPNACHVFRLANRAMLLSLARSRATRDRPLGSPFIETDISRIPVDSLHWRPFQIAFFLISLKGLWDPTHADRKTVDLIWFPTGGGKTEAYLAVAAFEMIRRRVIEGDRGAGTAVIKRYTLRLLTIQQFERAGGLICALETLRKRKEIPGAIPFSLGLWVGKESSPNDFKAAKEDLKTILNAAGKVEGVKVPLKQCPTCGTTIIPVNKAQGGDGVGMIERGGGIELFCPNPCCTFHDGLPISFIDDFLYQHPPTMLLGTVDKFAMLAWREEARAFFGTGKGVNPPSLIIQDELHLISGPLGTLTGIYEAAIDAAISQLGRPAKYICATATIRRADDQIRKLYGREGSLFPPPGLDASNSFFSRAVTDGHGRLYLGAMGQGHTPTFSNVISSTALLSAAGAMRARLGDCVDTWWTLVAYHNSKRELGKTLNLAKDDIPARLQALGAPRTIKPNGVMELSANRKDSEIPEALHNLAVALPDKSTLDLVACTNMLSVGVDIQRLGLMMVNGQPKTVSEYIQASSRVGRDSSRPPGVVFVQFSPTKPRDRSHYESFRAFHTAYYRHVEPTSVTPFAMPAQERGLHGAFLALVRMVSSINKNAHASQILDSAKSGEIDALADAYLDRIAQARDGDREATRKRLDDFISYWRALAMDFRKNLRFQSGGREHASLIRPFKGVGEGKETLQSLRNVDIPLKLFVPTIQSAQGPVQP